MHEGAQPRLVEEGIPFLGFIVFPDRRRLKRRKGVHFAHKLRRAIAAYRRGDIEMSQIHESVSGWVNHVRYANTIGLRKAIFEANPIPKRGQA
jgi:hypothetical protein